MGNQLTLTRVIHVVRRATNDLALAMWAVEDALLPQRGNICLVAYGDIELAQHGFDYKQCLPLAEDTFLIGDGNNLLAGVGRAIELATDDPAHTPRTVIVVYADIPDEQLESVIHRVTGAPPHVKFLFIEQAKGGATYFSGATVVPFGTDLSEDYALTPLLEELVS